jgi:pilus assembly protein CpaC
MANTNGKWVWGRAGISVLLIAVLGMPTIYAQGLTVRGASTLAAGTEPDTSAVRLFVGRSTVVDVGSPIARVSLTSPDVADALVTSPSQLLVNGKMPGTISMFVWDRGGALRRYEVTVQRDITGLRDQYKQLFPAEQIEVQGNGRNIVLAGMVSSKDVVERAISVASGYVSSKDEVVSLLQLSPTAPSNQVMLRVRFAEVSRSALTELGASIFTSPTGINNTLGRITTGQFSSPDYSDLSWSKANSDFGSSVTAASGKLNFGDFLNFFLLSEKYDLGAVVRLLQTKGMFQSLAEPNLVAESGKEASFLAGGEIPIPVAQGSGANLAISVVYKEFGIRLNFTPIVNGDRVHLKVRPEVSTLDFNNAVSMNGFRIPALSTRRTETELELQNGQSFAIAGLMNNAVRNSLQKVPGIGDIPIIGLLFNSKAAQKEQTELVVMITPVILPNNSPGVTPNLPRTPEPFLAPLPDAKTHQAQPPAFSAGRQGASAAPVTVPTASTPEPTRTTAGAQAPATPATAAATVKALTPAAPKPVETKAAPTAAAPKAAETKAAAPPPAPAATKAAAPPPAPARPMTDQEKKALERAKKDEDERAKQQAKLDEKAKAEAIKKQTAEILAARHKAEEEKARQQKLDREQQKKSEEAARKAGEEARKQTDADRDQQKSLDAAAAELKAAEERYNAELAKKKQN